MLSPRCWKTSVVMYGVVLKCYSYLPVYLDLIDYNLLMIGYYYCPQRYCCCLPLIRDDYECLFHGLVPSKNNKNNLVYSGLDFDTSIFKKWVEVISFILSASFFRYMRCFTNNKPRNIVLRKVKISPL